MWEPSKSVRYRLPSRAAGHCCWLPWAHGAGLGAPAVAVGWVVGVSTGGRRGRPAGWVGWWVGGASERWAGRLTPGVGLGWAFHAAGGPAFHSRGVVGCIKTAPGHSCRSGGIGGIAMRAVGLCGGCRLGAPALVPLYVNMLYFWECEGGGVAAGGAVGGAFWVGAAGRAAPGANRVGLRLPVGACAAVFRCLTCLCPAPGGSSAPAAGAVRFCGVDVRVGGCAAPRPPSPPPPLPPLPALPLVWPVCGCGGGCACCAVLSGHHAAIPLLKPQHAPVAPLRRCV